MSLSAPRSVCALGRTGGTIAWASVPKGRLMDRRERDHDQTVARAAFLLPTSALSADTGADRRRHRALEVGQGERLLEHRDSDVGRVIAGDVDHTQIRQPKA